MFLSYSLYGIYQIWTIFKNLFDIRRVFFAHFINFFPKIQNLCQSLKILYLTNQFSRSSDIYKFVFWNFDPTMNHMDLFSDALLQQLPYITVDTDRVCRSSQGSQYQYIQIYCYLGSYLVVRVTFNTSYYNQLAKQSVLSFNNSLFFVSCRYDFELFNFSAASYFNLVQENGTWK